MRILKLARGGNCCLSARRFRSATALLPCLLALSTACSQNSAGGSWYGGKSSRDYLNMALESENPDERRKGVKGLAGGPDVGSEWAWKVFDTIARTDTSPVVRSAAVRAMAVSARPEGISTISKILKTPSEQFEDVKPAPASVRWDAAKALAGLAGNEAMAAHGGQIRALVLDRIGRESDRNVRLVYIEILARHPHRPVPDILVGLLEEDDFAINRAAENSLIALTGTTHHRDPAKWREWLARQDNPFANAGHIPPEAEIKSRSNWDW